MPLVQWNESYSLKNAVLDTQHKKLFGILNRLYDDAMDNVNESAYETAVGRLLFYTNYHFDTEEQIMGKCNHPFLYDHAQEHQSFTEKIGELKNNIGHDSKEKTKVLIEFLVNWIVHHVVVEDHKIAY